MTFEEWLRTVCFQPPTPEAKDLARCAWDRQQARIAELEEFETGAKALIEHLIETVPEARPALVPFVEAILAKQPKR